MQCTFHGADQSSLHAKLPEFFFLLRYKCAFDCSVVKLVTHLAEVSVRLKSSSTTNPNSDATFAKVDYESRLTL